MATPATLASARFQTLLARHQGAAHWHLQPCPGLAAAIEQGDAGAPLLHALLQRFAAELHDAGVDTVVLGCTHYPFIATPLRALLGEHVMLIDTAAAIAERAASLWPQSSAGPADLALQTTGDAQLLTRLAARWLGCDAIAQHVVV